MGEGEAYFVFGGCVTGVRACVVSRCARVCVCEYFNGQEGKGRGMGRVSTVRLSPRWPRQPGFWLRSAGVVGVWRRGLLGGGGFGGGRRVCGA